MAQYTGFFPSKIVYGSIAKSPVDHLPGLSKVTTAWEFILDALNFLALAKSWIVKALEWQKHSNDHKHQYIELNMVD